MPETLTIESTVKTPFILRLESRSRVVFKFSSVSSEKYDNRD